MLPNCRNQIGFDTACLALLLKNEIHGYGFALACDFLKENYSPEYAKPDTHIQVIFYSLHLSKKKFKPNKKMKTIKRTRMRTY